MRKGVEISVIKGVSVWNGETYSGCVFIWNGQEVYYHPVVRDPEKRMILRLPSRCEELLKSMASNFNDLFLFPDDKKVRAELKEQYFALIKLKHHFHTSPLVLIVCKMQPQFRSQILGIGIVDREIWVDTVQKEELLKKLFDEMPRDSNLFEIGQMGQESRIDRIDRRD